LTLIKFSFASGTSEMPTILKRKYSDGSTAYVAQVRIKPFRPTSKSFPKKSDALAWADELERQLRAKKHEDVRADVTALTIAQLVREFLDDPEVRAKRYHADLELLLAWWVNHMGSTKVLQLGVLKLREARTKLRAGRAPATVNRYLSALRSAWNWGRASGVMPVDRVWPPKLMFTEPDERKRFLSDEELQAVLAAASKHSTLMNAAIVTSIACGMRQGELLRLRWSDVDLEKQSIRILLTKNGDARAVYLPSAAAVALRALKREKVLGKSIFVDDKGQPVEKSWLEYRWRVIRASAGLQNFRWHDLRHSCASFLAQQGATLLEIGSVLGHKSASMTKRYAHLVQAKPVTGHAKLDEKLSSKL
jgi:integrase